MMPVESAARSMQTARAVDVACDPDFAFDAPEYAALYARSDATAFQHPVWMSEFHNRLVPHRGGRAHVITGSVAGELVFVLPLILRRKAGLRLLETTDLGVSDYAAPIIDRQWLSEILASPPAVRDLVKSRVASLLPAHDILRVRPVRQEHAALWTLLMPGRLEALDFSAHATGLRESHTAWRAEALSPSFRKTLERKLKRFPASGEAVRLERDSAAIRSAIAAIRSLRAGRFEGDLIQDPVVCDFYQTVAERGASIGFAGTYSLMLDGQRIGHTFGISDRGRFNYLLIGCDYETHGRLSPGLVLYDGMIREFGTRGGTVFDFTIGDEPFKMDFGTTPTPMVRLVNAASLAGRAALWMESASKQIRALRPIQTAKP